MKNVFRNEADLQSWFTRWLGTEEGFWYVKNRGGAVAYEMKLAKRKDLKKAATLPDSAVKEHQVLNLLRAAGWRGREVMRHKISDSAIGFKPFDAVAMCEAAGELVVCFEGEGVFSVPILEWWKETRGRKRGSVDAAWCAKCGEQVAKGEK